MSIDINKGGGGDIDVKVQRFPSFVFPDKVIMPFFPKYKTSFPFLLDWTKAHEDKHSGVGRIQLCLRFSALSQFFPIMPD